MSIQSFTVNRQKYQGSSYSFATTVIVSEQGRIEIPDFVDHVRDEILSAVNYMLKVPFVISVETSTGYQIKRAKEPKFLNSETMYGNKS